MKRVEGQSLKVVSTPHGQRNEGQRSPGWKLKVIDSCILLRKYYSILESDIQDFH
jgi:hypothetical protein